MKEWWQTSLVPQSVMLFKHHPELSWSIWICNVVFTLWLSLMFCCCNDSCRNYEGKSTTDSQRVQRTTSIMAFFTLEFNVINRLQQKLLTTTPFTDRVLLWLPVGHEILPHPCFGKAILSIFEKSVICIVILDKISLSPNHGRLLPNGRLLESALGF